MFFGRRKIKTLEDLKKSKSFCINPWVHLFVSQKGTVGPCCLTSWEEDQTFGNVNEQAITEIWNSKKIKEFRKTMLADKADSRCHQCYTNEANGLRSKRKTVNFLYADYLPWINQTKLNGYSKTSKPIYWDIRISNLCNLRCRICGHHSSSSWYDDSKEMGSASYAEKIHKGPKKFDELMRQLDFSIDNLEEVYFAGGEPILMPEHLQLINKLVEKKKFNVRLRYNTNFSQTHFKDTDFLEVWKKFDDVFVHASLDDGEERVMLQRKGLDWQAVLDNRKKMQAVCPEVDFMLTPTISVFNILSLAEFHKKLVVEKFIKIDEFIPHVLKSPKYYSVQVLPAELKRKVKSLFEKHIEWIIDYAKINPPEEPKPEHLIKWGEKFDLMGITKVTGHGKLDIQINELIQCLRFMNASDESHLIPEFLKVTNTLDKLRNESTREINPELESLWQIKYE